MSKKIGANIILGSFFVGLCLSWFVWLFVENYVDTTNYENREMTQQPRFTIDGYATFASEYESWFNDNIPFRNILISLNTSIDFFVFNKSTNEDVIKGNDEWLFYSNQSDGDPIACYQGTNLLTEEELRQIVQNCIKQRDVLREDGKEFIIFVAPNKERIYSEYMPDRYGAPASDYKALQVYSYLKEHTDIDIIYPYEEIISAKSLGENLYFKTDTHWNELGAYVGTSALLKELGIEMPSVFGNEINVRRGNNTSGDLANMLNLSKQLSNTDWNYVVEGYSTNQIEYLEQDFYTVFHYKSTGTDPRKIYMIRDSFATSMAPYVASQFSETYMRHNSTYSYEDYASFDSDIVVYETVERNISTLGWFSIR